MSSLNGIFFEGPWKVDSTTSLEPLTWTIPSITCFTPHSSSFGSTDSNNSTERHVRFSQSQHISDGDGDPSSFLHKRPTMSILEAEDESYGSLNNAGGRVRSAWSIKKTFDGDSDSVVATFGSTTSSEQYEHSRYPHGHRGSSLPPCLSNEPNPPAPDATLASWKQPPNRRFTPYPRTSGNSSKTFTRRRSSSVPPVLFNHGYAGYYRQSLHTPAHQVIDVDIDHLPTRNKPTRGRSQSPPHVQNTSDIPAFTHKRNTSRHRMGPSQEVCLPETHFEDKSAPKIQFRLQPDGLTLSAPPAVTSSTLENLQELSRAPKVLGGSSSPYHNRICKGMRLKDKKLYYFLWEGLGDLSEPPLLPEGFQVTEKSIAPGDIFTYTNRNNGKKVSWSLRGIYDGVPQWEDVEVGDMTTIKDVQYVFSLSEAGEPQWLRPKTIMNRKRIGALKYQQT